MKCLNCKKIFEDKYRKDRKYCSISCSNKSRIWKSDSKEKIKKSRLGKSTMTEDGRRKISSIHTGRIDSKETRLKKSIAQRGEKGSNWQGGKSILKEQLRKSLKYRSWRTECFIRDGYKCRECEKHSRKLECHHIVAWAKLLEKYEIKSYDQAIENDKLWKTSNGLTLCEDCHKLTKTNNR